MFFTLTVFSVVISAMSIWSLSEENRKKANRLIFRTLRMEEDSEESFFHKKKLPLISEEEKQRLFLHEEMRSIVDFFESVENLDHVYKRASSTARSMEANGILAYIYGRNDTAKRIIFNVGGHRVLEVMFAKDNSIEEIVDDLKFIDFQNIAVFSTLLERYLTKIFESKSVYSHDQQQMVTSRIFVVSDDQKKDAMAYKPNGYKDTLDNDTLGILKESLKSAKSVPRRKVLNDLIFQIEYLDNLSSPFDVERQHRYERLRNTLLVDLFQSYLAYSPSDQVVNENKLFQALQLISDEMNSLISHKKGEIDRHFEKQVSLIKSSR